MRGRSRHRIDRDTSTAAQRPRPGSEAPSPDRPLRAGRSPREETSPASGCSRSGRSRRPATAAPTRGRAHHRRFRGLPPAPTGLRPGRSPSPGNGRRVPSPGRRRETRPAGHRRARGAAVYPRHPRRRCVLPLLVRREDDDAAAWLLALGCRRNALDVVHRVVHDLAVGRVHRFEHPSLPGRPHRSGDLTSESLQRLPALLPVPGHVDEDPAVVSTGPALHDRASEVLQCGERRALGPDQQPDVVPGHDDLDRVLVHLPDTDRRSSGEGREEPAHEGARDLSLRLERNVLGHLRASPIPATLCLRLSLRPTRLPFGTLRRRCRLVIPTLSTPTAVAALVFRAGCGRTNASPDPCLATNTAEEPRSGLAKDLELGILLVHAELVQGQVLGLLDGAPDGLDPLHLTGPAWTGDCRSALHPSPLPHFRSGWSARSGWSWPTWASAWA